MCMRNQSMIFIIFKWVLEQGKCSIHCALCERGGKCVECEVGYYGPTCSLKCLVDCGLKGCKQNTGTCDGMQKKLRSKCYNMIAFVCFFSFLISCHKF